MNLKEKLEKLIRDSLNEVNDSAASEFEIIAMESQENFRLALEVKDAWNTLHPDISYDPEKRENCQKFVLGYTLPWIADPAIRFLRLHKCVAPDYGRWEGGEYFLAVYDVHGVEKSCTNWDDKMKPLPIGCAYEGVQCD